ncbi:MAG: hypothetical protein DI585_07140 [Pseudomonas fluorescens]|nr:MAG: hypothetical protein DI585_07140 [Pseudomonas fluorescens]
MSTETSAISQPSLETLENNVCNAAQRNGIEPMHPYTRPHVVNLVELLTFQKEMTAKEIASVLSALGLSVTRNAVVGYWKRWYTSKNRPIPQTSRSTLNPNRISTAKRVRKTVQTVSHVKPAAKVLHTPSQKVAVMPTPAKVTPTETSVATPASCQPSARRRLEDMLIDREYRLLSSYPESAG